MKENSKKIILDLCGGTGSWSKPYKDAGYPIVLITSPEYDVTLFTYSDKYIVFKGKKRLDYLVVPIESIHGILAAPPCTMFSRARTKAKTPRDFVGAMKVVEACLKIIWICRSADTGLSRDRKLKFWALENPMGYLRQFLGNPGFSFQPYEYGDLHFKWTDIWGYFNPPTKTHKKKPKKFNREMWANPPKPKDFEHMKLDRAARRAITPQGFAKAFYKANQ